MWCLCGLMIGLLLLRTEAEDCTGLPKESDVRSSFNSLLLSQGGEGGGTFTIGDGPFYTCQAQGSTMGTYREASVVMTYTRNAAPSTILIRQFELDCTDSAANTWSDRSNSLSTPGNGFDYMKSLRTDCASCVTSISPPNENHCQPCDSACNTTGLMRCTGRLSTDCCVVFDNGVCRDDLNCTKTDFVANEQNNYTCACGVTCDSGYALNSTSCSCILTDTCLANSPCVNGVCMLGSTPDQYTCNCAGTNFIGTNCSACNISCDPGFGLNSTSCSCILTDTCLANSPCANGVCMLGSTPDQYTCNCAGTNFIGTNCSACRVTCDSGYALNSTSCSCILTDTCLANSPCVNGVCMLGSTPDQYTCNCTGTNFIGANCSDGKNKQCMITSPLKVTPFHTPNDSVIPPVYAFHGVCEHVFAKTCNGQQLSIVGDFLSEDLATGRVGLQVARNSYIILEDMTVETEDTLVSSNIVGNDEIKVYAGGVLVTTTRMSGAITGVEVSHETLGVRIIRDASTVSIFVVPEMTGCLQGLCGSETSGVLTFAESGMIVNDLMNQAQLDGFANSWQREPSQQILRDDRKECAVLRTDTVIGDPLFEAALWFEDGRREFNYSLCYEIHGRSNQHFNLISDTCVSVNGHYTPMRNPAMGNIISSMGIRATDNNGSCQNIAIVHNHTSSKCELYVNNARMSSEYNQAGVSARLRSSDTKVRVSVPNCEQLPLVMWVKCQTISNESMIRFDIMRGVNLRPTSHGLLGQFWNIQLTARHFNDTSFLEKIPAEFHQSYDISNLWVITVNPPSDKIRQFVAEKYVWAWDGSKQVCLYAGNPQGGPAAEYGFRDSVIEGSYADYSVTGLHMTNFKYSQFDEGQC